MRRRPRKRTSGIDVQTFLARKALQEKFERFHRERLHAEAPWVETLTMVTRPIESADMAGDGRRLPDIEPNGALLLTTRIYPR